MCPDRKMLPDIDLDFDEDGRSYVIEWRMANLTSVINVQPRISTNPHKLFRPDGNLRKLGIP